MKSSKKPFIKKIANLAAFLLAVAAAIGMWFTVNRSAQVEAQLKVSLNYKDIPPNLIVTKGLEDSLTVRVRGPKTLLQALSGENLSGIKSLGSIKKGYNEVPLATNDIMAYPKLRSLTIVDIQPPKLEVFAEPLIERKVKVETVQESPVRPGTLVAEEIGVTPTMVTVRGPESKVANMSELVLKIPLDATKLEDDRWLTLDTPSYVTADPNRVHVRYKITSTMVQLTRSCKISIAQKGVNAKYEIEPPSIDVTVEVPEILEKSASYLAGLELSVLPPDLNPGESRKLKVRTRVPEGMKLISLSQDEVTVTLK